ncbi:MAG: AAA family ATPase, partial [Clostridia bacterium]|nr:AAA family ATPase [Clostridia bacterium]
YGVVLIDELDLFLHPRWQRRVVGDLQKTFPNVQFVATTHSPFIIQSVQDGCVLDLENMENIQKPGTASPAPTAEYESRSIEDITEDLMGVTIPQRSRRYHEMYETAKEYYTLLHSTAVSEEEKRQKRQKLDALIAPFSQDVAYHAFLEMERLAMEANDASSK